MPGLIEALECRRMMIVEDRFEVNDTFALATDLGSAGDIFEGGLSIHDAADQDVFRVTAAGAGELTISISFIHVLGDLDLLLYDENQQLIDDSFGTGNTEEVSAVAAAGTTFYAVVVGFQDEVNDYELEIRGPGGSGGLPAWLDPTSAATWDDFTQTLNVTGLATIVADPQASGDVPVINVDGGEADLLIDPETDLVVHIAELNLTNNGEAVVVSLGGDRTAGNHRVLVANAVTVNVLEESGLDLTDNDLIVDYTGASVAGEIEDVVAAGFNGGGWDGGGIYSSVAAADGNFHLAVADNVALAAPFGSAAGGAPFAGVDVDLTSVLIKFTHRVDFNLDGLITPDDAAIFGTFYDDSVTSGHPWVAGDIDYDGACTPTDAAIFGTFYDESLPLV